jgi:hypothetical protein
MTGVFVRKQFERDEVQVRSETSEKQISVSGEDIKEVGRHTRMGATPSFPVHVYSISSTYHIQITLRLADGTLVQIPSLC